MKHITYTCDCCGKEISHSYEVNEISLNGTVIELCDGCYGSLGASFFEARDQLRLEKHLKRVENDNI